MDRGVIQTQAGLCASCRHARVVRTERSAFWLCERSRSDPAFPRYPRLPVLRCRGYEARTSDAVERDAPSSSGAPEGDYW
jgi:hypothetical protein